MNVNTVQTTPFQPLQYTRDPDSTAALFDKHFAVRLANTRRTRDLVYQMRYKVYCDEFGWEDGSRFPDRRETDSYDSKSMHCVILQRSSGLPAASVRLIPTDPVDPEAPLPFEKHLYQSMEYKHFDELRRNRSTACEISRLTVARTFRRRARESSAKDDLIPGKSWQLTQEERKIFPLVGISVILAATVLTEAAERRNVFAMMEPFLPRAIGRTGLKVTQVGPPVNYHGRRAAYSIPTYSAQHRIVGAFRELYEDIKETLTSEIRAAVIRRDATTRKIQL